VKDHIKGLTRSGFLEKVFDYEKQAEWQYQGQKPCVIAFHDESCPPCKAMETSFREVARIYCERVDFYSVDFTTESQLAAELGVKNLPTLVFCPIGDKPVVLQGAATAGKLKDTVERELLRNDAAEGEV
jgi:thioredoxin-like negative regulator of GroEL